MALQNIFKETERRHGASDLQRHVLERLFQPAPDLEHSARVDRLLLGERLEGDGEESVLSRVDNTRQLVPQARKNKTRARCRSAILRRKESMGERGKLTWPG